MPPKSKRFLITVFLAGQLADHELSRLTPLPDGFYGQYERCPDTSRLHLQAVYTSKTSVSIVAAAAAVNRLLEAAFPTEFQPSHAELLATPDDLDRSTRYCSKADTRVLGPFGVTPRTRKPAAVGAGKSSSRPNVVALAASGMTASSILTTHPELWRGVSSIKAVCDLLAPRAPDRRDVITYFITGPAGSGKTHATAKLPHLTRLSADIPYITNYTYINEPHAFVYDDICQFESSSSPLFNFILEMADPFTPTRRILYGTVRPAHTIFAMTSNFTVYEMLKQVTHIDRQIAFVRRINYFITIVARGDIRVAVPKYTANSWQLDDIVAPPEVAALFASDSPPPPPPSLDEGTQIVL